MKETVWKYDLLSLNYAQRDPLAFGINLPDQISDCLFYQFGPKGEGPFSDFFKNAGECEWLISSDYCNQDPNKKNDVVAFTVSRLPEDLDEAAKEIRSYLPQDIKKYSPSCPSDVSIDALRFMRSSDLFHFCFILSRDRFIGRENESNWAGGAFDSKGRTYWMHGFVDILLSKLKEEKKDDWDLAKKLEIIRTKMLNNTDFPYHIFTDAIIKASIAATIAALIAKKGKPQKIVWLSDRENDGKNNVLQCIDIISYEFFKEHYRSYCQKRSIQHGNIPLVSGDTDSENMRFFQDDFIRPADWLAGPIASCNTLAMRLKNRNGKTLKSTHGNENQLGLNCLYDRIFQGVVNNPDNLLLMELSLPHAFASLQVYEVTSTKPIKQQKPKRT